MRLCAAQIKSVKGDINANVPRHRWFIDLAVSHRADLIFFPELSLCGYEPTLVKDIATDAQDKRLDEFQEVADAYGVVVGVGLPTRHHAHVRISQVWFQPQRERLTYSKQQLHADELPFFVRGDRELLISADEHTLAPAICYESLQPEHAAAATQKGADVYLARWRSRAATSSRHMSTTLPSRSAIR